MADLEEWEHLDNDDVDLGNLIRTTATPSHINFEQQHPPILSVPTGPQKRSFLSQIRSHTHDIRNKLKQPRTHKNNTEKLESNPESRLTLPPVPDDQHVPRQAETSNRRRIFSSIRIPGPAGNLQRDSHGINNCVSDNRHVNCGSQDYDPDFEESHWHAALDYANHQADCFSEANVSLKSVLDSFKQQGNIDRIPQLLGVIKTFVPNKMGGFFVTIKDPTGSISGSIHNKVIDQSEFGKDISVGSVLLLQQVVLFSPTPWAHYLNITVNNILKVFKKGSYQMGSARDASLRRKGKAANTGDPLMEAGTSKAFNVQRVSKTNRVINHTDEDPAAAIRQRERSEIPHEEENEVRLTQRDVPFNSEDIGPITSVSVESSHQRSMLDRTMFVQPLSDPGIQSDETNSRNSKNGNSTRASSINVNVENNFNTWISSGLPRVEAYHNTNPSFSVTIDWDENVEMLMDDSPNILG